ncbi:MAG TPA: hypothetical protein VGH51_22040 [Candidatus Angelobacter sp.]|jgi:hypothetical protein
MSLFSGAIFIGVSNIDAAVAWYKEKFELRESPDPVVDGEPGDVELVSRNGAVHVVMSRAAAAPSRRQCSIRATPKKPENGCWRAA